MRRELTEGATENLAGISCGHVHFAHADTYREGRYQYVAARGFEGACRVTTIKPL